MKQDTEESNTKYRKTANIDHVVKYTGVFGIVQSLKILLNLVRNKLTARFLGTVGMGLNATYLNVSEIVNSCTNFGIYISAVKRLSELQGEEDRQECTHFIEVIRTWSLWTGLFAMVLMLCSAPLFGQFFFQSYTSHLFPLLLISIAVLVMPIEAGECAVLKGMRRLKTLAKVETISTIVILLTTVPFYYLWGIGGVVFAIVVSQIGVALVHLFFTVRLFPYRLSLTSMECFHTGLPMIKIGIPYVLAAVAGAFSTAFIFGYLQDPSQIGLYKAGYVLVVTYGGIAFAAVEADYFPRLSSVNRVCSQMNQTINQQIVVCVIMLTPLLILFALFLPIIVPLVYKSEFLPVVPMCTISCIYLYLRGIVVPMEYTALAKGDPMMYLMMEVIYDVAVVLLVRYFFDMYGLTGVGFGLTLTVIFNLVLVLVIYGWRYGCRITFRTMRIVAFQFICLLFVVVLCMRFALLWKCVFGALVFAISVTMSIMMFSRESEAMSHLLQKIKSKCKRVC